MGDFLGKIRLLLEEVFTRPAGGANPEVLPNYSDTSRSSSEGRNIKAETPQNKKWMKTTVSKGCQTISKDETNSLVMSMGRRRSTVNRLHSGFKTKY